MISLGNKKNFSTQLNNKEKSAINLPQPQGYSSSNAEASNFNIIINKNILKENYNIQPDAVNAKNNDDIKIMSNKKDKPFSSYLVNNNLIINPNENPTRNYNTPHKKLAFNPDFILQEQPFMSIDPKNSSNIFNSFGQSGIIKNY